MNICEIEIEKLVSNPDNPNVMGKKEFENLKREISRRGFLVPVLVRKIGEEEFEIIDGHHRVEAAKELGIKKIPSIILDVDEKTARFLMINLNQIRGSFDFISYSLLIEKMVKEYSESEVLENLYLTKKELDILKKSVDFSVLEKFVEKSEDTNPKLKLVVEVKSLRYKGEEIEIDNDLIKFTGKELKIDDLPEFVLKKRKNKWIVEFVWKLEK